MHRSLLLLLSCAVGAAALGACASESATAASARETTEPETEHGLKEDGATNDKTGPEDENAKTDAGEATDAATDGGAKDAATGPVAFTKTEMQTLVNARCAPCHTTTASAGMKLANDFTAATVNVASSQVPTMKRIAPGNKEASYLFHKLSGTHLTVGGSGLRMPRNGPPYLTDGDIARIGAFIDGL